MSNRDISFRTSFEQNSIIFYSYISQGGFAVIDVGNHGHVPDVKLVVHDGSHLLGGKVHLHLLRRECQSEYSPVSSELIYQSHPYPVDGTSKWGWRLTMIKACGLKNIQKQCGYQRCGNTFSSKLRARHCKDRDTSFNAQNVDKWFRSGTRAISPQGIELLKCMVTTKTNNCTAGCVSYVQYIWRWFSSFRQPETL